MGISLKFPLCFLVDQLIDFELNESIEIIQVSCINTNPPYHKYHELVLHSLIRQGYILRKGTKLGKLQILCLNKKVKFVPLQYPEKLLNQLANKTEELKTTNSRRNSSNTLARLLLLKQNKVQYLLEGNLYDTGSKQVHVKMLANLADVNENLIPRKNGKFKNYNDTIDRLNAIIMGQYLIRSNMCIEPDDVKEFQNNDPYLQKIISQLQEDPPAKNVDKSFVLIKQLLFKIEMIFGERIYKLCLPPLICGQILQILHDSVKSHLPRESLVNHFNKNFFTRGITDISKKIVSKCLHCSLNIKKRKLNVKGENRTHGENLVPGQIWYLDVLVLPRSSSGNAFALVFTERLSSYVSALPLKNITNQAVCEAFRKFLSVMPSCQEVRTDHGISDFGPAFTMECLSHGIEHRGEIPRRSESQGSVEISNQILANQLSKICSSQNGSRNWDKSLSRGVQVVNNYHPYNCKFSRTQLLFSPFIYCSKGGHMSLNNPVKAIKETFTNLNNKRIANLLNKRSKKVEGDWAIGQFVLLTDETNVGAEARGKLSIPNRSRLYKIIDLNKNSFTATILDVLNGSKREVLTSRLANLDLETLEEFNFSSPTFYKNLQRLTDIVRKKYVPPKFNPPQGLHLLTPDVLRDDHGTDITGGNDVRENVTGDDITDNNHSNNHSITDYDHSMYKLGGSIGHGDTVELPASIGHAPVPADRHDRLGENGEGYGEGEGEDGGQVEGDGEQEEGSVGHGEGNGGSGKGDVLEGEERDIPETMRTMRTRFMGRKHVAVYNTDSTHETHESTQMPGTHKSILTPH